ncbi:MAG: restriction endonuclease subunit S [Oscillospiraceae bacterium]|nr:restriction endonuclease subunit S [Oscillospiraceae bacterium]
MNLDTTTWKEFCISDLFDISVTKDSNLFNSNVGQTPFVASSSVNNGVTGYVDVEPSQKANTITIARNGSVGSTFYQPADYCASPDDIRVLTPKFKLTPLIGMFISTIIKQERFKYSYGRKLSTARIKKLIIKLPVDNKGLPDYAFMGKYIRSLNAEPIKTKIIKRTMSFDTEKWGEFKIGDFFVVKRGKRIVRDRDYFMQPTGEYKYNVITSTKQNNSVDGYYHSFNCPANSIVCGGEAGGMFTTYQPTECWVMDRARIFIPKNGVIVNKYTALFLATIFGQNQYKYSYGRTPNPRGIEETIIRLPVKNNIPDWSYMEKYIKSLLYGDRI